MQSLNQINVCLLLIYWHIIFKCFLDLNNLQIKMTFCEGLSYLV